MPQGESRNAVPVALYVRTLAGDPDNSLPTQFHALQVYARGRGLHVAGVYFDVQGGRSQYEAMMAEVTGDDPPFRQILVRDPGRLPGEADGQENMRTQLEGKGVSVVFLRAPGE